MVDKNKDNKKEKEVVKPEVVEEPPKLKFTEQMKFNMKELTGNPWFKAGIVMSVLVGILMFVLSAIMFRNITDSIAQQVMLGLAMLGIFAALASWKLVEKTIGFGFVINLWRLNRLKRSGWIVLKIHTVSGRPVYRIVKDDKLIYYDWMENGDLKRKLVISQPYAKYFDFGGDYTVMECTPNDINPINRFDGSRINTTPELIEKHVVDASKTYDEIQSLRKWRKYMIWGAIGIAGAFYIMWDLNTQQLIICQDRILDIAAAQASQGIIIAGGLVKKWK